MLSLHTLSDFCSVEKKKKKTLKLHASIPVGTFSCYHREWFHFWPSNSWCFVASNVTPPGMSRWVPSYAGSMRSISICLCNGLLDHCKGSLELISWMEDVSGCLHLGFSPPSSCLSIRRFADCCLAESFFLALSEINSAHRCVYSTRIEICDISLKEHERPTYKLLLAFSPICNKLQLRQGPDSLSQFAWFLLDFISQTTLLVDGDLLHLSKKMSSYLTENADRKRPLVGN